jgi:hypothetical protein
MLVIVTPPRGRHENLLHSYLNVCKTRVRQVYQKHQMFIGDGAQTLTLAIPAPTKLSAYFFSLSYPAKHDNHAVEFKT